MSTPMCRCDYAQTGVEHEGEDCVRYLRDKVRSLDRELVQARQQLDALQCANEIAIPRLMAERDAERARRERLDRELDALAYEIETSSSGYQLRVAAKRARVTQRTLNEEARAVLTEEHH